MRFPFYTFLFKNFLYPFYNAIIGRNTFEIAAKRISTQSVSSEELRNIQFNKLKAVLVNAMLHVPYYRKRFKELNFNPMEMSSIDEFEELDFYITKADVRADPNSFISDICDRSKLTWHRTGGSTGEPLCFPTDPVTNSASASALVRSLSWWNIEFGERHAMFWGSPQFIARGPLGNVRKWINVGRNKLMNRLFFSNYNLNIENIDVYRKQLESFRPKYVRGMPSSLYIFAKTILERGGSLSNGAPLIVHSACEQLFDWQRETIEKGFNSIVVNTYGLSELADIAYGAPCGKMHIMEEDVFLETRDFGLGEKEVVATQLNNLMSPLIRYRTADVADAIGLCGCKLNLRVIFGLKGRAHDFIVTADGKFLHGQLFTHLIVYEPGILNYQIRQLSYTSVLISLVTSIEYKVASEVRLRSSIKKYMGLNVDVNFIYLDSIALTPSGKHRWIISDVASNLL